MASRIVYFTNKIGGVFTDVTQVSFGNEAGTIALRNADTLVAHEPPIVGTALAKTATGRYSYTFEDLEAGAEYEYWINYTYAGNTTHLERSFTAGLVSDPECYLFNMQELIDRYGMKQLAEASNKDQETDDEPDYDAIQQAMDYACDQVHQALPNYAAPFDFTPNNGVVIPTVREWAFVICFENLWNSRGDTDKNTNPYRRQVDAVYNEMTLYAMPIRKLKVVESTSHSYTPSSE